MRADKPNENAALPIATKPIRNRQVEGSIPLGGSPLSRWLRRVVPFLVPPPPPFPLPDARSPNERRFDEASQAAKPTRTLVRWVLRW